MIDIAGGIRRGIVPWIYRSVGLNVFGYYRWLREAENWPPAKRSEWRLRKLGDILAFAWNHVPFYREFWGDHGVTFRRPRAVEELGEYPVLTKDLFRSNCEAIKADNVKSIRCLQRHTGGTTGMPIHYLLDLENWAFTQAFHLWGWGQTGYRFGDRVAIVAGGSLIPKNSTLRGKIRSFLERKFFLYGVQMDRDLAQTYWRKLSDYGASHIYGYPSILAMFATHLAEQKLAIRGLKAVITTAEMLLPQYRKTIEEGLGCPVFNHLGCNDGGYMSYECYRHDGLHYNDFQSVLETWENGENGAGSLLITNLWNKSHPFIRYENGDIVALEKSACPCGQGFPRIAAVEGRTMDILTFSNGRSLSGPALTLIFGKMEIDGWQVVQRARDRLEVRIRCEGEINTAYERHIREVMGYHLGDGVKISVVKVDRLERTAGGKLKPVWAELDSAAGEKRAT